MIIFISIVDILRIFLLQKYIYFLSTIAHNIFQLAAVTHDDKVKEIRDLKPFLKLVSVI